MLNQQDPANSIHIWKRAKTTKVITTDFHFEWMTLNEFPKQLLKEYYI